MVNNFARYIPHKHWWNKISTFVQITKIHRQKGYPPNTGTSKYKIKDNITYDVHVLQYVFATLTVKDDP